MKTIVFAIMCASSLAWMAARCFRRPSTAFASVDAIVAAYNEEPCIEHSLRNLLCNAYIRSVICVNDGSTDGTAVILDRMAKEDLRLKVVHQPNSGKGGALMHGLSFASSEHVFITDADTHVPPFDDGLGYMLMELELGADAVGGIPSSNLRGAGLLPHIRATVKLPMIQVKRTFQQIIGGAPFLISGACGMFRTSALRAVGFSDRTRVEDLDLTWSLIARGYTVRQSNRSIVYSQECNSLRDEWLRWRRWITGYAVCMRLHRGLLLSRYGIGSILPMFLVVVLGVASYSYSVTMSATTVGPQGLPAILFPPLWLAVVMVVTILSAVHHRRPLLLLLGPLALIYVILAYAIWALHGISGLFTGREHERDKPTRYAHVVG